MELTAAASGLTPVAYWLNTTFASFDLSVAQAVHALYVALPWFFTPLFKFVTFLISTEGSIMICLALAIWPKTRRYGLPMCCCIAVGALITNLALKPLVLRPRPYTWEGSAYQTFWELMGKPTESDFSFPSGHTTAAFAMAFAVAATGKKLGHKKAPLIYIVAVLGGISRIYLSVHYCTDVIGGTLSGTLGGLGGMFLAGKVPEELYTCGLKLPSNLPLPDFLKHFASSDGKHVRK